MPITWMIKSIDVAGLFLLLHLTGYLPAVRFAPQVHTVEIKDMKFQPATLKVRKGDTVLWINRDLVTHDVTEENRKEWSSSPIPSGKSWQMKVTQSADYYCSIHQVMKGKLLVE